MMGWVQPVLMSIILIAIMTIMLMVLIIKDSAFDDYDDNDGETGNVRAENIWFSWYKLSKYREKLICHACDGRTDGGRRKVENRAVFCWTRNRNIVFSRYKSWGESKYSFPIVQKWGAVEI